MPSMSETLLDQFNKIGQPYKSTGTSTTTQTDTRPAMQKFTDTLMSMLPSLFQSMILQNYLKQQQTPGDMTPITGPSLEPGFTPALQTDTSIPAIQGLTGANASGGQGMDLISMFLKNILGSMR